MDEKEILQKYLADFLPFLTSEVFRVISPSELLDIKTPKVWFQNGRQLQADEINMLRQEAKIMLEGKLWSNIRDQLLYHATQIVPRLAKSPADLVAGKVELYIVKTVDDALQGMLKS